MRTINNIKTAEFYNLHLNRLNDIKLSYFSKSENFAPITIQDTETTVRTYTINDFEIHKNSYFFILISCIYTTTDDLSSQKVDLFVYNGSNLIACSNKQFVETEALINDYNEISVFCISKLTDNKIIIKSTRTGASALVCDQINISIFNLPINDNITKNNTLEIIES